MPLKQKILASVSLVGFIIVVAVGGLLWHANQQHSDPEGLFYDALESALSQSGLTCIIDQTANGQQSHQAISLDLASRSNAKATVIVTQNGASAQTEQLAIGGTEYIRYIRLSATKGSPPKDFSKALNVWAKQPQHPGGGLYGGAALGSCVLPMADLNGTERQKVMTQLRKGDAFVTNFAASKQQQSDQGTQRVYDVKVQPGPYVSLMKQLGGITRLSTLDQLDTEAYAQRSAANLRFYIDSRSARVEHIDTVGAHRIVRFMDYGKRPQVSVPKPVVTTEELTKLLES